MATFSDKVLLKIGINGILVKRAVLANPVLGFTLDLFKPQPIITRILHIKLMANVMRVDSARLVRHMIPE